MARIIVDTERLAAKADGRWDLATYPRPLPPDERPKKVATERMLWKRDGSLAAAIGKEYLVEDEPLLITHDEFVAIDPTPDSLRPSAPKKAKR